MAYCPPTTIAQLLFESTPVKTFPALVRDLDNALSSRGGECHIRWDNEDLVFVDFNDTRVGLGYFENPVSGLAACLTITVGPAPDADTFTAARLHDHLCRRLVNCANDSLNADKVLWHETADPVTCDTVDELIDQLEPVVARSSWPGIKMARAEVMDAVISPPKPAAEKITVPYASAYEDPEIARILKAMRFDPNDGIPSQTQRASAHILNAAMMLIMPPVGAGLVAASYRYGVNLHHSARAMGATGAFLALTQSASAMEFITFLPI